MKVFDRILHELQYLDIVFTTFLHRIWASWIRNFRVVIGKDQSFNMGQPTTTDVCDAKSKNITMHSTKGPKLVYSTEQRRGLELLVLVEVKCSIVQRDGYDSLVI